MGPEALLLRWAVGGASRQEVRTGTADVAAQGITVLEGPLSELDDDALVLFFWESRTGGLEARTLGDVRLSNWPLLSQTKAPETCLAGTGITHVVINQGALRYYLVRGASPVVFRIDQLREFVQRCMVEQREFPPYLMFSLRNPQPGAEGPPPP
jgi:hypothetical protein